MNPVNIRIQENTLYDKPIGGFLVAMYCGLDKEASFAADTIDEMVNGIAEQLKEWQAEENEGGED